MSTGEAVFSAGEKMSPYYNGVIKSCAVAIAPPAVVFGLSVQALATSVYMNQCNPGDMMKAAGAWIKLAEKNWEAAEELTTQVDTVDEGNWCGKDADAFRESATNVDAQLKELAVVAFMIGAQLIALAVALTVYWVFLTACTVVMDVFLAAYTAAYAGVVTAVGAESIRASCLAVAASLVATAKSFEATITSISTACAALTGTLTAFTFGFQKSAGNPVSAADIAGAGLVNMLEGFATYALRSLTMTPAGRHAQMTGWTQGLHGLQAVNGIFPTYQGDGDWEGGYDGGGTGLGAVDGLANLWEDHAPDSLTNPDEARWR